MVLVVLIVVYYYERMDRMSYLKLQRKAIQAVNHAIKNGILPHPSSLNCADCSKPATGYDHRDYTKPLEVAPVCHSCNSERGHAINIGKDAREAMNEARRNTMKTDKVNQLKCERCGHTWVTRKPLPFSPHQCPQCKSPYWSKPRRKA